MSSTSYGIEPAVSQSGKVTILLTNYNGLENLRFCVPGVLRAAGHQGLVDEVLVVDDCSTDASVAFLQREHPQVRTIVLASRSSFLGAANAGFAHARSRYVALLSNDMVPCEDFLAKLLPHFRDTDVFAVSSALFDPAGRLEGGRRVGVFLLGTLFLLESAKNFRPLSGLVRGRDEGVAPSLYVGGNALFDREKFLELGGFDPLYHPFYWEDTDLCYRAWKRGWKVLVEPESRVTHHQRLGTIRRNFDRSFVVTVRKRNRLLFMWKNLTDPLLMFQHVVLLCLQTLFSWVTGDLGFYRSLYAALGRLGEVRKRRRAVRGSSQRSDREVLRLASDGTAR